MMETSVCNWLPVIARFFLVGKNSCQFALDKDLIIKLVYG